MCVKFAKNEDSYIIMVVLYLIIIYGMNKLNNSQENLNLEIDSSDTRAERLVYDVEKSSHKQEEINQERVETKRKQEEKANLLSILLNKNKTEFIEKILNLWWYGIKDSDFDLELKNNQIVIISKSSYFSSIVGLNGINEKKITREKTKSREIYDNFDKLLKDLFHSNVSKKDAKDQLFKYCSDNRIDYESIITGWGCVISEWDNSFVWLKELFWPINLDENEWTILHEKQHIKFNLYCKSENIHQNSDIKILDEVIAHCYNCKKDWIVDFDKIMDSMDNNENYIKKSWLSNNDYMEHLQKIIYDVKESMWENYSSDNIDLVMINLIKKYSD